MKNGFTLIEVMISVAILGITVLAVSSFVGTATQSIHNMRSDEDRNNLVTELKNALNSQIGCTGNFGTTPNANNYTVPPNGSIPVAVSYTNSTGYRTGAPIAQAGSSYSNYINVTSLNLVDMGMGVLPNSQQMLKLHIVTAKSGYAPGLQEGVTDIPILATVNGSGQIVSCEGSFQNGGDVSLGNTVCRLVSLEISQSGAHPVSYNPTTGQCGPANCYLGSATAATCPSGTTLVGCWSSVSSGTTPLVATTYNDGSSHGGGPPAMIPTENTLTNSCSCIYANGIVGQCQACCQ